MEIVELNRVSSGGLLHELRQLCLQNLDSFTSIAGLNSYGRTFKFNMLNHLKVCGCKKLEYLFPLYVLKDLQQLENIDISDCGQLKQVFMGEQETQMTNSNVMEEALPLLHSLKLSNLPELASICSGDFQLISRSLTQMTVEKCSKFVFTFAYNLRIVEEQEASTEKSKEMIVCPEKLKTLYLRDVDHLKKMCMYRDLRVSFMNLTSLQLQGCNKLEYMFSLSMAQKLRSLQELKIISCEMIKQIVKRESEERAITVKFPQVETLILRQLLKFTGSYSQHGVSVRWLALATVKVDGCPEIQSSMLGQVDRPLLTNVSVSNCSPWGFDNRERNIGYLFDLTDELSKLKNLKIKDLKELKKYMEMEFQQSSFTQLETLEASQCDNELSKFLSILLDRAYNLKQLKIQRCELMEQVLDLTNFVAEEQRNLKFPNLETIQLIGLSKLKCIWSKDPEGILGLDKLVKLEIIGCGLRKSPLSTALLGKVVLLKELKIESCKIEQVVDGDTEMQERSFPNLEDLQLASLPELIKFNSGHCSFSFPKLMRLRIEKCPKLNVLSNQTLTVNEGTSDHGPLKEMGNPCPKLQTLKLADLEMLEDISQGQYSTISLCDLEDVEVDSFSRLTYMRIVSSEKLKTLVVRNCSSLRHLILPSNCSTLTKIEISGCNNLEVISTDSKQVKTDKKTSSDLKSIVLENLPKLSSFSLKTRQFSKLQKLIIVNCPRLETLPRNVSTELDNSNKHSAALVLFDAIKEDSSTGEGLMKIPPQLESLVLADLPNMQLWKQEPRVPVFQKLTSLKIMRCGIKKLFSIPVAESLEELKLLTLYGCVDMVQVLQDGRRTGDGVFFKNLETLVLKHLPSLTSFCEEDVDFKAFPKLKMVRVEDVPNMYTFVKDPLNTPELKHVRLTFISKCWQGSLNKTIEYLHEKHDKLKDEVWKSALISSTRHHTDTPESSSLGSSRFKEVVAEMELQ